MIRIPTYEQQTALSGVGPQPHASAVPVSNADGEALSKVGAGLADVWQGDLAQRVVDARLLAQKQKADDELTALKNVSQASLDLQTQIETLKGSAKPGAFGFAGDAKKLIDDYMAKVGEAGGTEYYRQQFMKHMLPVQHSLFTNALSYEATEGRAHRVSLVGDAIVNSAKTVSQNPDTLDVELGRITSMLEADKDNPFGLLPHQRDAAVQKARESLSDQAIWRKIQDNPAQAKADILKALTGKDAPVRPGISAAVASGQPGGFDSASQFVLGIEGGYSAKDGNSGAPVNFGINQRANPDVDVKNLTRDGAVQLYRDRYWNAINADNLPPATAAVAFDTAINMGVGKAKQLLAETGGDPAAMIARRREIYTTMADTPNQRANLTGWLSRMDKLEKYVGSIPGTPSQPDPVDATFDPQARTRVGDTAIDIASAPRLEHWLAVANTEAHKSDALLRQSVDKAFTDHVAMLKDGVMPQIPLTRGQILAAYAANPIEGMQKADTYEDALQVGKNVGAMKMLPSMQLMGYLDRKPDPNSTNYAREERLLGAQAAAAQAILKQRSDDFVGWAYKNKVGTINPINWADPAAVQKEMPNRAAVGTMAAEWGNGYQILSASEVGQLADTMKAMQPKDQARLLGQIRASGGDQALLSVSRQLQSKNDDIAIAGMLSTRESMKNRNVAELFLEGVQMMAQDRAKFDAKKETGTKAEIYKAIDGAYSSPQARDAAARAALGIFAKLESEGNGDVERAVALATGGLIKQNGQNVPKPYGWTDSQFRDSLATVTPATITALAAGRQIVANGQALTSEQVAQSLPGAKLQSLGDGVYAIRSGSDIVRTQDGRPLAITLSGSGAMSAPAVGSGGVVAPRQHAPQVSMMNRKPI